MSLNALPTELVWAISTRVHPDTIEAYGRTCSRIRTVAAPLIEEHRKLQNEFTRARLEQAGAARLIYAIASRPWIKLYPQTVELVGGKVPVLGHRPTTAKAQWLRKELDEVREKVDEDEVRQLIEGTGLIRPDEVDLYLSGIRDASDDFVFALLLAILPNVQRIDLLCQANKLDRVKEMVRRIGRQASNAHRRALSNLRSVHIVEQGSPNDCDLELFPIFALLPGLEDLYGKNLAGLFRPCYRDGWATYPGASPSITNITLETCGMSVEGLEMLMKRLRKLRSFKYIAHHARYPPHSLFQLLKSSLSSLQILEISSAGGSSRYVGSLRNFMDLRKVTLDTDMLMRNGRMQRAVDILPSSIEKVILSGNNLTPTQQQNFLMDLYRPAFTYPRLRCIGVEDSYGLRVIGADRLRFQKEFHKQSTSSWMMRYS